MMLPSHLLASLLLGLLLARSRPLEARDWLLALGFGVVIDLDHLLQLPAYVATHGTAALTPTAVLHWGGAWQGFMHTGWALLLVVPAMLVFRSWLPLVFWGLHMLQDFVVARHLVRFGGPIEWLIVALLAGAVLLVLHLGRDGAPLLDHAWRTFGLPPRAGEAPPAEAPA
jgi:hypothetical protein